MTRRRRWTRWTESRRRRRVSPRYPRRRRLRFISFFILQSSRPRRDRVDRRERNLRPLRGRTGRLRRRRRRQKFDPRDAPNEKEAEAAVVAVAPPSAHSREYEVAYKAAYDAALAAAEAEAAALRARLADTHYDGFATGDKPEHVSVTRFGRQGERGGERVRRGKTTHRRVVPLVVRLGDLREGVSRRVVDRGTARAPGGTRERCDARTGSRREDGEGASRGGCHPGETREERRVRARVRRGVLARVPSQVIR